MLFLLSCLAVAFGAGDENVQVLTTSNFEDFISGNDRVLVEFYAPWCGHCKALEPEYNKAADQLKAGGAVTRLAKVDATVENDLASKFGVKGFPTLKYFTGNADKAADYGGGRTEDTIVSWLNKRELPAVSTLTSADETESLKGKEKLVLVGFCGDDSDEAKKLADWAEEQRDHALTGQGTEALAKELGFDFPSYVLFRDFKKDNPAKGSDFGEIDSFFQTNRFPILAEIGPENYQLYMERGLPIAWLSVNTDDEDSRNAFEAAAAGFAGKFSAVWVDAVKFKQHVESNLGITGVPGLMIVGSENDKYKFTADFNTENVQTFFEGFSAGTLDKFLKTQDPPAPNDDPVKVIVGSTFDEMVTKNENQGKFVEFYAPWCGHCKKLAPIWDELAAKYNDNDKILIAKVDATENDTPENVQGFPTLVYYPPTGEKEKYGGGRELDDLESFVEKKLGEMAKKADAEPATHDEL